MKQNGSNLKSGDIVKLYYDVGIILLKVEHIGEINSIRNRFSIDGYEINSTSGRVEESLIEGLCYFNNYKKLTSEQLLAELL